jgi:hypothetical protein
VIYTTDPSILLCHSVHRLQWWFSNLWVLHTQPSLTMCCYFNTSLHCDAFLSMPNQPGRACTECAQVRPHFSELATPPDDYLEYIAYDAATRSVHHITLLEMERIITKITNDASQQRDALTCQYPSSRSEHLIPIGAASTTCIREQIITTLESDDALNANNLLSRYNVYDAMVTSGSTHSEIGSHIATHILCAFTKRLLHYEYSTGHASLYYINLLHLQLQHRQFLGHLTAADEIQLYLLWIRACLTACHRTSTLPFCYKQCALIHSRRSSIPLRIPLSNPHNHGIGHSTSIHRIWYTIQQYIPTAHNANVTAFVPWATLIACRCSTRPKRRYSSLDSSSATHTMLRRHTHARLNNGLRQSSPPPTTRGLKRQLPSTAPSSPAATDASTLPIPTASPVTKRRVKRLKLLLKRTFSNPGPAHSPTPSPPPPRK